jgi:hypothetical protein
MLLQCCGFQRLVTWKVYAVCTFSTINGWRCALNCCCDRLFIYEEDLSSSLLALSLDKLHGSQFVPDFSNEIVYFKARVIA